MINVLDLADVADADEDERALIVAGGVAAFRSDGCLLLNGAFDTTLIEDLHHAYSDRHGLQGRPRGALQVGNQRYMITVRLQAPFTDARLYSAPVLSEIVAELLGDDWSLFSFGAVVSHPGAEDQHVHSDGQSLFGDRELDATLPPYAITTIIPLVEMNDETGTTRVWPRSHRLTGGDLEDITPYDPLVPRGSVLLMDYRLRHGGLANRSSSQRPILSLVLTRPWFDDAINFTEQAPLSYDASDLSRMPPELAGRLAASSTPSTHRSAMGDWRRLSARVRARIRRS